MSFHLGFKVNWLTFSERIWPIKNPTITHIKIQTEKQIFDCFRLNLSRIMNEFDSYILARATSRDYLRKRLTITQADCSNLRGMWVRRRYLRDGEKTHIDKELKTLEYIHEISSPFSEDAFSNVRVSLYWVPDRVHPNKEPPKNQACI